MLWNHTGAEDYSSAHFKLMINHKRSLFSLRVCGTTLVWEIVLPSGLKPRHIMSAPLTGEESMVLFLMVLD